MDGNITWRWMRDMICPRWQVGQLQHTGGYHGHRSVSFRRVFESNKCHDPGQCDHDSQWSVRVVLWLNIPRDSRLRHSDRLYGFPLLRQP